MSPTYCAWQNMLKRCTNPSASGFKHYGGRGITVCEEWLTFENFLSDMGERPPGKTLDRFPDNDGGYGPGNCRWATRKEQANNRREAISVKRLEHNGISLKLTEWANRLGIDKATLSGRLARGWSVDRALSSMPRHVETVCHNGETKTLAEWARLHGLKYATILKRYHDGEQAPRLFRPLNRNSFDGKLVKDIARERGVNYPTLLRAFHRGENPSTFVPMNNSASGKLAAAARWSDQRVQQ
jgi:hypothetical protein